jgi:hypothetical protein
MRSVPPGPEHRAIDRWAHDRRPHSGRPQPRRPQPRRPQPRRPHSGGAQPRRPQARWPHSGRPPRRRSEGWRTWTEGGPVQTRRTRTHRAAWAQSRPSLHKVNRRHVRDGARHLLGARQDGSGRHTAAKSGPNQRGDRPRAHSNHVFPQSAGPRPPSSLAQAWQVRDPETKRKALAPKPWPLAGTIKAFAPTPTRPIVGGAPDGANAVRM